MHCWLDTTYYDNDKIAFVDDRRSITYRELWSEVIKAKKQLQALQFGRVGLLMGNSIEWIVVDLACSLANVTVVPLPDFFSDGQLSHIMSAASLDLIITDNPSRISNITSCITKQVASSLGDLLMLKMKQAPIKNVRKITFTSGSTGEPKGVSLSQESLETVVHSFYDLLSNFMGRHFCLLPLSTLLENVAGIYTSILATGTVYLTKTISIYALKPENANSLFEYTIRHKINTIIIVPQILKLFVVWFSTYKQTHNFTFIALGGGKTSPALIEKAQQMNLPVYEGYGLSEATSVVSLNTPTKHKHGSVGKLLAHVQIKFMPDGEIAVKGADCIGYYDMDCSKYRDSEGYWLTGDIGYRDNEDYLYLSGRKKNFIITGLGRNISPEWLEAELCSEIEVLQAAVVSYDNGANITAVIVPSHSAIDVSDLLSRVNSRLPGYANILSVVLAHEAFTHQNGQLSQGGQPLRPIIKSYHQPVEAENHAI